MKYASGKVWILVAFLIGMCYCFAVNSQEFDPAEHLESDERASEKSTHKLSGNLTFVSDYRSRGISQTICQPAIQGELQYEHSSGVYLKTWASNVDGTNQFISNTSMEWDFYLGYQHSIDKTGISYDVGLEAYYYPGGFALVSNKTSYNTLEYYLGFQYKGFEIRLSDTISDFFGVNSSNTPTNWDKQRRVRPNGNSRGSPYYEFNYSCNASKRAKIFTHIGYQIVINYPELNYLDWLVGASYHFDWVDASLYYVQTNAKEAFYKIPKSANSKHRVNLGGPTVVFGITKGF